MKGLELSKKYYQEHKASFETAFGPLMDRIAIGMVGPGSECLGFDDEYSRDHDWGPSFCLWVTDEDYKNYGSKLQQFYLQLPEGCASFSGRKATKGEQGRVGVISTSSFYKRYTGLSQPPVTLSEWNIPPSNLLLCTNGKVFSDPLGEFSRWRETLKKYYPEDVRRKRIADCCMRAGQAGQYNWQRGIMRGDPFVVNQAKMQFCTEVMNLVFLLNKLYAPYFKWLYKGFSKLPILGQELTPSIDSFMRNNHEIVGDDGAWEKQQELTVYICKSLIQELRAQGLSNSSAPFLVDHVHEIISGIEDKNYASTMWGQN